MSAMEKEITELQQKQNVTVMFSAYLGSSVTLPSHNVVVFNRLTTNAGNGYDPATGLFTCPVSGYYVLDVHVQGQHNSLVAVFMYLNGSEIAYAYADDNAEYESASGHLEVLLKQGDRVNVKTFHTSYLTGHGNRPCTFSGHLVNLL